MRWLVESGFDDGRVASALARLEVPSEPGAPIDRETYLAEPVAGAQALRRGCGRRFEYEIEGPIVRVASG